MADRDRRSFLSGAIASLGLVAAGTGNSLASLPQSSASPSATGGARGIIDMHHHFAPPEWVAAVEGRPLLQRANTMWTPEKSIEDMDKGDVAAAIVSITNPGLWFGDKEATSRLAHMQ